MRVPHSVRTTSPESASRVPQRGAPPVCSSTILTAVEEWIHSTAPSCQGTICLRPMEAASHLTTIQSASVVTLAYDQIRAMIVTGEIEPGSRLGQVELAESLGVSRPPVREALRRLVGEGLVTSRANHGFRVADLGLESVMRPLEVRFLIEPGIARLAAARRTDEDLAKIMGSIDDEAAAGN